MTNKYDLSILIPSRNEMFLARTIQDILENSSERTEVIAVLDGAWADPGVPDHERVTLVYLPESVGQRAATNIACRLSKAKYVMKADAHTAWDKDFDTKMIEAFEEAGDDVTMVPVMRNLHAFNWVCPDGHTRYQGPSGACNDCGKETTRDVVWIPKPSPQSTAYRFDTEMHFQYANEIKKRPEIQRGTLVGYELSYNSSSESPLVIDALTTFASSHPFPLNSDLSGSGEDVPSDTVSFPSINSSGGIRTLKIGCISNKLQVGGVATSPVLTEVINNGDILTPSPGNSPYKKGVGESVDHFSDSEVRAVSVTTPVQTPLPVPTASNRVNSDVIEELGNVIGTEFVYSEKAGSFHAGSITLSPIYDKDLVETPSLQGSAFMCTRDKYWELNLSDEALGSWGQQGVEVAMKTWLSGGRVLVNKRTWYAHMFRTQGGDFSFPYPQRPYSEIVATREKTRDLFVNGKWDKAKHDFNWYLDKFKPLPGWHDNTVDKNIGDMEIPDDNKKGIIFFTDNRLNLKIAHAVQKQLKKIGLPIISSSLKPMTFGDKNVVIDGERGYHTYFKQIVAALETSTAEIVFFCEHDVLYPPEHFEFTPPDNKFYYNQNWIKAEWKDGWTGRAVAWDADQVSGLVVNRETALAYYKKILDNFNPETFNRSFEPQGGVAWRSKIPYVDIRQPNTLTKSKWSLADFRDKSSARNFRGVEIPEWAKELL